MYKSEEGVGAPGARFTGLCEPPNMGAGKQTQMPRKNATGS